MKRFFNSKGVAFIPFLLGVGIIFGVCGLAGHLNWKKAQPPTKKIHLKVIKEDPTRWIGGKKVIIDIPVRVPDKK